MRRRDVLVSGGGWRWRSRSACSCSAATIWSIASSARASRTARASRPTSGSPRRSAMRPGSAPATAPFPRCSAAISSGVSERVLEPRPQHLPRERASSSASRRRRRWSCAIGWLAYALRAQPAQRRRAMRSIHASGVAATVLVGLHALLDFSLEIPAVAVTYAAILGVACGRARGRADRRPAGGWRVAGGPRGRAAWRSPQRSRSRSWRSRCRGSSPSSPRCRRALVVRQLDAAPGAAGRQRSIARSRPAARAAAWADADEHWSRVARAELALAERRPGCCRNARRSRLERADQALRQALAAAPANPAAWAQLAYVTLLLRGDAAATSTARSRSRCSPARTTAALMPLRSAVAARGLGPARPAPTRSLFASQFVKTMAFAPAAVRRGDPPQRGVRWSARSSRTSRAASASSSACC